MKKNQMELVVVAIIAIIVVLIAVFILVFNEQCNFIGTWQYSVGGTITFKNDNTAIIDNIGPLRLTELIGTITYKIANNQVTFTSGSVSVSLDYTIQDSNTLVLTDNNGDSITVTKV